MPRFLRAVCCRALLCLLCLATAAPRPASAQVFTLSAAHSHVTFTLSSFLHTVHGTFQVQRGHLRLTPADGAVSGECVVDARSGDSGSPARDRAMHHTVLDSEHYPEIVFVLSRIRGAVALVGTSTVNIDGTFTLHGSSHRLTTSAIVSVTGDDFTFSTHLVIPYVQWGLQDPSTFLLRVDKQVDITFEAAGHIER